VENVEGGEELDPKEAEELEEAWREGDNQKGKD